MRMTAILALTVMVLAGGTWVRAQETPAMPAPQKEHEWLKQLEGEWVTEGEAIMAPGQPAIKTKGTESVRPLGGFWSVNEMKVECMGMPVTGLMTVGYDIQKKKYVGSWVCSAGDMFCKYEGTLDGQVLTLETEGPNPATGKLVKMKDVIEIKDKDHRILKSSMLEDGKWVTFMTLTSTRKK